MLRKLIRYSLCVVVVLTTPVWSHCQTYCDYKYDYVWIMGGIDIDTTEDIFGGNEINFNTSPPSLYEHPKYYRMPFQNTSMSSRNGDLLFYSNGCLILNALDEQMMNGDSLNPGKFYEDFCPDYGYIGFQNMITIPNSYEDSMYFLFHIDKVDSPDTSLPYTIISENLFYSSIDMSGDNGLGEVIEKNQSIIRDTSMLGGPLTAVRHANGLDWWMLTPNRLSNSYNIILVSEEGPEFIERQYIGELPDPNSVGGQGKFTPDGSRFAWYHPSNGLYLFDFDRQEGRLSEFQHIQIPAYSGVTGGLEFSPSGRFLYVNHDTSLFQLDILSTDIQSSLTHIADYDGFVDILPTPFFLMERTPDHRIIMNSFFGTEWLHVIQEPEKKGTACRFEQHSLKLPTVNNFTLPHFPNYRLGPLGEPLCDSIWVSTEYPQEPSKYKLGPIPTSGILHVYTPEDYVDDDFELSIFDLHGNTILTSRERRIELLDLPPGVYICRISDSTGYTQVSKIVAAR